MNSQTLLPNNRTAFESTLEATSASTFTRLDVGLETATQPAHCLEAFLPWLAWAFSVDFWNPLWALEVRRAVVGASVSVHKRKGTVASVKDAIESLGYVDYSIREGGNQILRDGSVTRDGGTLRNSSGDWAEYIVDILNRPISLAQAAELRKVLERTAPARCFLSEINYTQVANIRNGSILRDGTQTRGTV